MICIRYMNGSAIVNSCITKNVTSENKIISIYLSIYMLDILVPFSLTNICPL